MVVFRGVKNSFPPPQGKRKEKGKKKVKVNSGRKGRMGKGREEEGGKDREGEGREVDGRKGKWMEGRGQVGKEISREGD